MAIRWMRRLFNFSICNAEELICVAIITIEDFRTRRASCRLIATLPYLLQVALLISLILDSASVVSHFQRELALAVTVLYDVARF